MLINHHPSDALIMAYTSGSLNMALAIAVETHIALCPDCLQTMRNWETVGGTLLEDIEPTDLDPDALEATFARIERAKEKKQITCEPIARSTHPEKQEFVLPGPLARRLGFYTIDEKKWRWFAPGIESIAIVPPEKGAGRTDLFRIQPGTKLVEHGHHGTELTLVLSGSFNDRGTTYKAGELSEIDEDIEHQPYVDSDVPCICLVAIGAPIRYKGFARLLQPLFRY
ncbi:ChrR family anti-sigma-E factor [Microvirga sp. W0021]|uniref:ChrR family anti-sigma-E factor n=1 Tax=Hohaiivirga grylli TaxID=3133970 RepID=A0ABV0BGZ0_9HYPH